MVFHVFIFILCIYVYNCKRKLNVNFNFLIIWRLKQQLKELNVLQKDAIIVRDKAKADLANLEKKVYADRRARDLEMQSVKREADEKRQQQEQFQRRIVRALHFIWYKLTQISVLFMYPLSIIIQLIVWVNIWMNWRMNESHYDNLSRWYNFILWFHFSRDVRNCFQLIYWRLLGAVLHKMNSHRSSDRW